MSSYEKPWLSVEDQLQQLVERGMTVSDRAKAVECIERIGYYRLSGYWFSFRERSELCCVWDVRAVGKPRHIKTDRIPLETFRSGTSFQNGVDLYVFDKRLRLMVLDALERIEIALRVDISHSLGQADRFAYLKPAFFHNNFAVKLEPETGLTKHHDWLGKHASLIGRSREEFIKHNKAKYGLPLAIWVACEAWDFGCMSNLFAGMKEADQDQIATQYGLGNGRVFASWLRSLNYLRNVCAHHSRLWNRNIVDQPKLPPLGEVPALEGFQGDVHAVRRARPFLLLCICQHLMQTIHPGSTWGARLKNLLEQDFPDLSHVGLTLQGMGVDEGWETRTW